jgi:DNA (cytosine-5)-methyltransferase 1
MTAAHGQEPLTCLSLFSSAGIGELGLEASGLEILVANELRPDRCGLYRENHPDTQLIEGDIWDLRGEVVSRCRDGLSGRELFLAYATPPCQGMSTNGSGKLKAEIAAGRRPKIDERNRLVIPAMDIVAELEPRWLLLENVPGMRGTVIADDQDRPWNVIDYIAERLGRDYQGGCAVLTSSDYGVPQLRRRLFTVFTRDDRGKEYLGAHRNAILDEEDRVTPLTLWDAIRDFPVLDATEGKNSAPDFHPLHRVGVMGKEKYWWVSHTPEGDTAYNNQCVNPNCLYDGNPRHIDEVRDGRAVASKTTPIYCAECGELLPRPTMVDKVTGERRLINGFHSAYRRMDRNKPARTITINYPFEASDNKVHPTQNRVLSTYEALVLQTIARYPYEWSVDGKPVNKSLVAQVIGESVPPFLIERIAKKMVDLSRQALKAEVQLELTPS